MLSIHTEIWISSRVLGKKFGTFTKKQLMSFIKEEFGDTRSGVSTHISSYCVASSKANPGKFRYLTKVGTGQYRIFKVGDPVHPSKKEAPLHPPLERIPEKYNRLIDFDAELDTDQDMIFDIGRDDRKITNLTSGNKINTFATDTLLDEILNGKEVLFRGTNSETNMRNLIMKIIYQELGLAGTWNFSDYNPSFKIRNGGNEFICAVERPISYSLPSGDVISHKSDIQIEDIIKDRIISLELKFRSAVTDQFKCRAYDMQNIKSSNPAVQGIMVYVKSDTGISIQHAKKISYPYDRFFAIKEKDARDRNNWKELINVISRNLLE